MSLVAFPFKTEAPQVLLSNITTAARHDAVDRVLCIGYEEESTYEAVAEHGPVIAAETDTPVELILQERVGSKRAGKGDGMNTGLRYFLERTESKRIHFYDSDITSFGPDWISKAEQAADLGYSVVRHYFPRASTDAMITWLITRTGFAKLFPRTELPWIEQPLGGELLFTRETVERLVADDRVQAQSDWGIDTLYTFATIQAGLATFETYVQQGKAHKLYGRLTDLRTMLVECFAAIQSVKDETVPEFVPHRIEPPGEVPQAIAEKLGFDFEASMALLTERWNGRADELLELFPVPIRDGMLANRQRPRFEFMGEDEWYEAYGIFIEHFDPADSDWRELLFKMWVARVLDYTVTQALRGFGPSQRYQRACLARYVRRSALPEL